MVPMGLESPMPLNEHSIQFEVNGQRLWGMLHLPLEVTQPVPTVLMLHGFTGQRLEPHRLFLLLSRQFAEAGIASMRFDFRGSGESEGTFDQMTVAREVEDVVAAYHFLKSRPEVDGSRLGLMGLSMGGMVSALSVAQPGLEFKALSLWAPAHPKLWLAQFPEGITPEQVRAAVADPAIRAEMRGGVPFDEHSGFLDFGGNAVSMDFIADMPTLHPFETVKAHKGPAQVVHGTADPAVPIAIGQQYAQALESRDTGTQNSTSFHAIQDGLHTFDSLVTQREVHAVTLEFFKTHLS
jgi:uncharacterized protein